MCYGKCKSIEEGGSHLFSSLTTVWTANKVSHLDLMWIQNMGGRPNSHLILVVIVHKYLNLNILTFSILLI